MNGLEAPENGGSIERIVDWLELSALFDERGRARLDTVLNAFEISEDYYDENIAHYDELVESTYSDIAVEIARRGEVLNGSYPFGISENGEQISLTCIGDVGQTAYLACLIIDHSWSAGLLMRPAKLNGCETIHSRNVFELVATVAASGFANGPAFLVGENRRGASGLLAYVARVCERAREGEARPEPPADAPRSANDDGVDVIALALERDGPPARAFIFGQAASGANWKSKSILVEIENFLETWFSRRPRRFEGIMLVPTILSEQDASRQPRRVGHILHRLRLPRYARRGAMLIEGDPSIVDIAEKLDTVGVWLNQYVVRVREQAKT